MPTNCPQCQRLIPEGNERCNLCGFDYYEYLKQQKNKQSPNQTKAPPLIGILVSIFTFGGAGIILLLDYLPEYLEKADPDKILKYVSYLPFSIPMFTVVIVLLMLIINFWYKNK